MMETWTLQEGFPLITVEVKGREVRLSQERYLKSDDPSQTSRFNINIKDWQFLNCYACDTDFIFYMIYSGFILLALWCCTVIYTHPKKSWTWFEKVKWSWKKYSHMQFFVVKMTTLEMIGKLISSSRNVWYWAQTKTYWKLFFFIDVNLKFGTQL